MEMLYLVTSVTNPVFSELNTSGSTLGLTVLLTVTCYSLHREYILLILVYCLAACCTAWLTLSLCASSAGSGIGTGPGVIQDRFSPTMGRHRSNPLFNGHGGHITPVPQSQFDIGGKSFMKSSQVSCVCGLEHKHTVS